MSAVGNMSAFTLNYGSTVICPRASNYRLCKFLASSLCRVDDLVKFLQIWTCTLYNCLVWCSNTCMVHIALWRFYQKAWIRLIQRERTKEQKKRRIDYHTYSQCCAYATVDRIDAAGVVTDRCELIARTKSSQRCNHKPMKLNREVSRNRRIRLPVKN